jgi:hypothetical protein
VDVLRNARRGSGQGLYDFKQPTENDPSWDLLLDAMWDYQWVKQPAPLSENLKRRIYDLTQGVTDFLAKLMILGQRYAIQSGREKLDEGVFEHVAATKMKLLLPAIAALRSGDIERMAKFEDLLPTDVQLEDMMKEDVVVVSDRVSVLRRQRQALISSSTSNTVPGGVADDSTEQEVAELSDQATMPRLVQVTKQRVVQEVFQLPSQRPVPLSANLAEHQDPVALLRDSRWILDDPFEFIPVYRAA